MRENQTEREKELERKLEERDQRLQEEQKKLKKFKKFKVGFFTLLSLLSSLCLWHCAPAVNVDYPTAPAASTICSGTSVLGTAGTALCALAGTSTVTTLYALLQANVNRNVGTTQITQNEEVTTYAGAGSTPDLPTNFREVPDVTKDDEGYNTADISGGCAGAGCSPSLPVPLATHIAYSNCGTSQTTIALRVADCAAVNGEGATWNGATYGTRGEGTWKLVVRKASRLEVWQDQRTGLLWSSLANNAANYSYSWCQGSGNIQSNYYNCAPGGGNQPATPVSFCAEMAGFVAGLGFADTPLTGPYANQKGGLGLGSVPSVKWRLPTLYDYLQAEVNGIRFVMPDMGALVLGPTYEWTATVASQNRAQGWVYSNDNMTVSRVARSTNYAIRCVGR